MNLLDEIGNIEAPTLKPTQKPKATQSLVLRQVEQEAPSSDLFDVTSIDEIEEREQFKQTGTLPSAFIYRTLQTNNRPALGISPLANTSHQASSIGHALPEDSLPFPIAPDSFSPESFLSNVGELPHGLSVHERNPLSSIPNVDKLSKVSLIVAMITGVDQPIGRDFLVTLSDDSGSFQATIQEKVFREVRKRPHYGMLLVLRDCSIFRPTAKSQCLVVVQQNIQHMLMNIFSVQ